MKTKSKYKYRLPLRWYDCRISLKGKEVFTILGQQYACTSRKCKSIHCIRFQTNKEAKIRLVNYFYTQPDYFVVLRLENIPFVLGWLITKCLLKGFKKQLKDDSKSNNFEFEWEFLIEFDEYGYPHFHMMIKNHGNNGRQEIESEFKKFLQKVWDRCIGNFKKKYEDDLGSIENLNGLSGSVYCEKVISVSGSAIYLSKGQKHILKYNPVPEEWDTTKCHIISRSRGFLVKTKKELLDIYNQNKEFFWKWKSDPLKDKQKVKITTAMASDPKDSSVVGDFKDEPIACETKETITENSFKDETIAIATKKPINKNPLSKVLVKSVWCFALVGGLIFAFNKLDFSKEKPSYHIIDSKSDGHQRNKFMLKWFLDNGFEYHQKE